MADVYSIRKSTLDAIGNAVREKDGTSADIPVIELEARIKAITTGVDTSADTVVADALTEGYTAHDAAGNLVNGANPYEKVTTNTTVNTQADLIAQIQTALEGKAAGGGGGEGSVETCTVSITSSNFIARVGYTTFDGVISANSIAVGEKECEVSNVVVGSMFVAVVSDISASSTTFQNATIVDSLSFDLEGSVIIFLKAGIT